MVPFDNALAESTCSTFDSDDTLKYKQGVLNHLVRSSPVLFRLKHSLPKHRHHLRVVFVSECVLSQFGHECSMWSPSLIIGSFTYFGFNLRVVHDHIGPERE